jgi:hypothetical protein
MGGLRSSEKFVALHNFRLKVVWHREQGPHVGPWVSLLNSFQIGGSISPNIPDSGKLLQCSGIFVAFLLQIPIL